MNKIKNLIGRIIRHMEQWGKSEISSTEYVNYLRSCGCKIGENNYFQSPSTSIVDTTRPSLIEIGDNCTFLANFTLLTHDFITKVFRNYYKDFIPSSGFVKVGNNVYCARNCTILKGVTIGDNCIVGYGSVVMKDMPSNSIVAGCPAKVICTLEDFYEKRKSKCIEEAFEYARSINTRYHRKPIPSDFWEEFPLFVSGNEVDKYPTIPIRRQLDSAYEHWVKNHKAKFYSFEDFLIAAGIDINENKKETNNQ